MRKIISTTVLIISVLSVTLLSGCLKSAQRASMSENGKELPSEDQLVLDVETLADGESIEYLGNYRFRSLDRDMKFTEGWGMNYSTGMYGGTYGNYVIDSNAYVKSDVLRDSGDANYRTAVMRYWSADIQSLIDNLGVDDSQIPDPFTDVYVKNDIDVMVIISRDISDEQIEKINGFLTGLRDICRAEGEFHSEGAPYGFHISFQVQVFFAEQNEDEMAYAGSIYIDSSTDDSGIDIRENVDWNADWYNEYDRAFYDGIVVEIYN